MHEVAVEAVPLHRLAALLDPAQAERLECAEQRARTVLGDKVVWNVNSTAHGGGVAEMLQALLAYARGAGVDARWLALTGDPAFFAITKRVHNMLHGVSGDGGPLGDAERHLIDQVLSANLAALRGRVRPGDIVLLHDPQTAGLVEGVQQLGAKAVWRCHIGRDRSNAFTDRAWEFLRPWLEGADAVIFSRPQYAPPWVLLDKLWVIPPSLDPFTAKNAELAPATVAATLRLAGLVDLQVETDHPRFTRRDGSSGNVREHHDLLVDGGRIPGDAQLVLQVGRWDRLKDPQGVMSAFAEHIAGLPPAAHLLLAGPDVAGVDDDPEGAGVLTECMTAWRRLPSRVRPRIHLACLPMDDVDENAHLVNALQRHAAVVAQKSVVEGFGLTVTEPMWKARPVVASAVGGIQDQIEDRVSGLLLRDPTDGDMFMREVRELLHDAGYAERLGTAARARVRDHFLGDRHLIQYVDLFASLQDRP